MPQITLYLLISFFLYFIVIGAESQIMKAAASLEKNIYYCKKDNAIFFAASVCYNVVL